MKFLGCDTLDRLRKTVLISASAFTLLSLTGCNDDDVNYCPNIEPSVSADGVNFIKQVSPNANLISCHNCYNDNSELLGDTLAVIEYNLTLPIDIIELDIELLSDKALITHQPDGSGVKLKEVFESTALVGADKFIFLELKNSINSTEQADYLLRAIEEYFNNIRTERGDVTIKAIVIRSAIDIDSTIIINERLASSTFVHLEGLVKTSHILYPKNTKATLSEVQQAYQCGSEMVEFSVRKGSQALDVKLSFASSLGLATNVYTLNESNYHEVIANGGTQSDVLTITKEEASATSSVRSTSLYEKVLSLITRQ